MTDLHPMASLELYATTKEGLPRAFRPINVCVVSEMTIDSHVVFSNVADKDTESTILPLPIYLCRRLLLPVIVVPDRMVQKLLDQRSTPQGAGKGKVSLGRLLYIISELGGTEPTLLSLNFTILGSPSNLFAP